MRNLFQKSVVSAFFACMSVFSIASSAQAADTLNPATSLVIHGVEMGIGHFHRKDNSVHAYGPTSAWLGYALPAQVNPTQDSAVTTLTNADGSETIFFSSLDELLTTAKQISQARKLPIGILNIEAHGLPGGMWYPKDRAQRDSGECSSWRDSAYGADDTAYNQYYGPVQKSEIQFFRSYAQSEDPGGMNPCIAGLTEWQEEIQKTGITSVLADGAEVHFISCIVGLGNAGNHFTTGMAQALFAGNKGGKVLTSVNFGLGDWSIPEGMGFWDYVTDEQLDRDNSNYVKNKNDREIAQPGTVRVSTVQNQKVRTELFSVPDKFLAIAVPVGTLPPQKESFGAYSERIERGGMSKPAVGFSRIPHTGAWVKAD